MWDQLTTFWSLDRAEKHYSLKEQPLNMPLGSQNPYAKRAYCNKIFHLTGRGLITDSLVQTTHSLIVHKVIMYIMPH